MLSVVLGLNFIFRLILQKFVFAWYDNAGQSADQSPQ